MKRRYRSLGERLLLYEEVLRLQQKGLGYKRISKTLEEMYGVRLNPGMICNWIGGRHNPLGRCNKIIQSPELAYVIGGWLGDGTLALDRRNCKHHVILRVKDFDFATEWGRCLATAFGIKKPYRPVWDKVNRRWSVKASSILLHMILSRARNNPWITSPYLEEYPAEALQGLFDAEGNVDGAFYHIRLRNAEMQLLKLARHLLQKLDVNSKIYTWKQQLYVKDPKSKKIYQRKQNIAYCLVISRRENIVRFAKKVGFRIRRKQKALEGLLQKYRSTSIYQLNFCS